MFTCTYVDCNNEYPTSEQLLLYIHGAHSKQFGFGIKCFFTGCNLKYQTMKAFTSHIKEKHENTKEYSSEFFFLVI